MAREKLIDFSRVAVARVGKSSFISGDFSAIALTPRGFFSLINDTRALVTEKTGLGTEIRQKALKQLQLRIFVCINLTTPLFRLPAPKVTCDSCHQ